MEREPSLVARNLEPEWWKRNAGEGQENGKPRQVDARASREGVLHGIQMAVISLGQ